MAGTWRVRRHRRWIEEHRFGASTRLVGDDLVEKLVCARELAGEEAGRRSGEAGRRGENAGTTGAGAGERRCLALGALQKSREEGQAYIMHT